MPYFDGVFKNKIKIYNKKKIIKLATSGRLLKIFEFKLFIWAQC